MKRVLVVLAVLAVVVAIPLSHSLKAADLARNSVESERPSELIGYATAVPFAIGLLETAFAIEDNNMGICR